MEKERLFYTVKFMKVLLNVFLLILVTGCASVPERPKGEFVYVEIEGFFKGVNDKDIEANKNQSHLICENESLKISIPRRSYAPAGDTLVSIYDSTYANTLANSQYFKAIANRKKYYENCMELKGWKKTWVLFEELGALEEN